MTTPRSYGDPCGIARALDLIGERWALLLVRELFFGPKRFGDLRAGLPSASPNVLSQRLRDLEEGGVVQRRKLEAPANVWVYELTPWGMALKPALLALGGWGARAPNRPPGDLGVDALMLALETTFDHDAARGLAATFAVTLDDAAFQVRVDDDGLSIARGRMDEADVTLETDAVTLRALVFGGRSVALARKAGTLRIHGDRAAATRFFRLFPRPAPAL